LIADAAHETELLSFFFKIAKEAVAECGNGPMNFSGSREATKHSIEPLNTAYRNEIRENDFFKI
jgi:uncharacterized protein (DUF1499 family)